jgi:hypothetical protein
MYNMDSKMSEEKYTTIHFFATWIASEARDDLQNAKGVTGSIWGEMVSPTFEYLLSLSLSLVLHTQVVVRNTQYCSGDKCAVMRAQT